MHGIRHPYSGALYEASVDGHIEVTSKDGEVGYYQTNGRHVSGAKFDVDPHLCSWVGAPRAAHRMMNTASH